MPIPTRLGFRLVDVTQQADVGDTGSGMGVASGDYDGDGRFDLFITNWERELNALYRNTTEPGGAHHLPVQHLSHRHQRPGQRHDRLGRHTSSTWTRTPTTICCSSTAAFR